MKTPEYEENKDFSIETEYQLYLQRVGLSETTMHPIQKIETKRAFYGGFITSLLLARDKISVFEEERAIFIMRKLEKESLDFWNKQK